MLKRLRDITLLPEEAENIRGTTLYGANDDKLGTVDDIILDPQAYAARYAVIDTGGWLSSRKFLVPADYIESLPNDPDRFYVPLTRQHIESFPRLGEDVLSSGERFTDYENRYNAKWASYQFPMPRIRHPRLTRFENDLRRRSDSRLNAHTVVTDSDRDVVTEKKPMASAMVNPQLTVYGVYSERSKLERAVERLKDFGFRSGDISVVFPDKGRTERFATEHNTKAPEGAATGGGTGMVVGGVLGWLAGIGTLAIPGIGPLLAAGPIVAALAGAGAGGAIGGLAGALIGMGMPEIEAKRYEKEIREGRMLMSVRCNDAREVASARSVLVETDAKDVFQTGERIAA